MWLCCLTAFRFLNPLYLLYCVCRVEAEEDNQHFRLFDSAINPFESLVFFLYPQAVGQISCNVCSVLNKLTLLTYQYETKQEDG